MDGVNKTLYIPLYGKAYVSRKGIILQDPKAEQIWQKEGFPLRGKSKSKWLAYYMSMRAAVFDAWVKEKLEETEDAVVLHLGCGMDSRALRVGNDSIVWYDVDFPDVIRARQQYFGESAVYRMLSGDAREGQWLENIPCGGAAVVAMEGVSMYISPEELEKLLERLAEHFGQVFLLMDCYTCLAAQMSRYRNPVRDVGVTQVYGLDDPHALCGSGMRFTAEHDVTPERYSRQLQGMERKIFEKLYAGKFSKKLYRMFEFSKK